MDQHARDALAFIDRGSPEAEIGYTEDAPRVTEEQLRQLKPVSIKFTKSRRRRILKA